MLKTILSAVILIGAVIAIGYYFIFFGQKKEPIVVAPEPQAVVTAQVNYQCSDGHEIKAVYMEKGPVPEVVPGELPVSNAYVVLNLDGSPSITLPQAVSADGSRYANTDESLVFWSKGSGVTIFENNQEKSYKNCIIVKDNPGNLDQVYLSEMNHFTLRYPADYIVDNSYSYQNQASSVGVKFSIPQAVATGTNLSSDSYISVESIRGASSCDASAFLSLAPSSTPQTIEDGDYTYSFASSSDAGAGNRYEEYVYALSDTNPCLAIRYFVHYSAIENYDEGTVKSFDKATLLSQFDLIRRSITLNLPMVPDVALLPDAYPLYKDLNWLTAESGKFNDIEGSVVKAKSVTGIENISAVTQPFEKYYADILTAKGWKEDIALAAGGPGSAVIAYKKTSDYIVLEYKSTFSVGKENEPAQCPCTVDFSVFSGTK